MPRSLSARVVVMMTLGIVLVAAGGLLVSGLAMFRNAERQALEQQEINMRVAWTVLQTYGQDIHEVNGILFAGERALDGFLEPVDRVKSIVGGAATVFHGDLRVATNVKKPDGSRAVGTRLAAGPVYDTVLRAGRPYRGQAQILGADYYVAYDPIKSANGAVLGALFVGVPRADFIAPVVDLEWRAALVSITLAILTAAAMFWTCRRAFAPLDGLRAVMERIARGERDIAVPGAARADDIGRMATVVMGFQDAATAREHQEAAARAERQAAESERAANSVLQADIERQQRAVVAALAAGLKALAGGDLTGRLDRVFGADYETVRADFNSTMSKLEDAMRLVAASASAIRSGTGEISTASDDLSRRTEQQAASLEETAAALNEITGTVRKTANGAKHARDVVSTARASAELSSRVVGQAMEAMSGIETSSREIGNIVGVIDEIAFQTNLLALNAGVEAARAGDAGRGFAVVASEVRGLAQRSADAAKDIKALIAKSGAQVERGVAFVSQTGEALAGIVVQVSEIDAIVAVIAASAQEQTSGLDQVNIAVNQMDQVTQQNAAMVEEATAASQALAQQTGELSRLIGQFQVGDAGERGAMRGAASVGPSPKRASAAMSRPRVVERGGAARKAKAEAEDWAEF